MRIGIALTVKNESVLLPRNIEFHRILGVDEFFVYFDHGSEITEKYVPNDFKVSSRCSVGHEDFTQRDLKRPVISKLLTLAGQHHTARQMLNAHHAISRARESQIEWLISIDADEIIYPFADIREGQSLKDFFSGMQEANSIRFLPTEVCPRAQDTNDPIFDRTCFLNVFRRTKGKFTDDASAVRIVYDPYRNMKVEYSGYLGHKIGKVAIRAHCDIEPDTVHNFRFADQSQSRQSEVLGLLHYNHYSFDDFLKKYQNFKARPDRYVYGGKVEYIPKLLWRKMVNDNRFSMAELREYFNRYIAYSDDEIEKLKTMNPSPIITIKSPRKLLIKTRNGRS